MKLDSKLRCAALRDIGRKRSSNQDSVGVFPDLGLCIVADGMGGHQGGEIASQLAVETIESSIREATARKEFEPAKAIRDAFHLANERIFQRSSDEPALNGMGTTAVLALVDGNSICFGNVGDSRAYLLHPGAIWQLTRDHSLVEDKVKAGLITREQAKTDAIKNIITRSVGFESVVFPDVFAMDLHAGDVVLLCSDGLSGMIDDARILQIADRRVFLERDLDGALQELIGSANQAGGLDNISAVLLEAQDMSEEVSAPE